MLPFCQTLHDDTESSWGRNPNTQPLQAPPPWTCHCLHTDLVVWALAAVGHVCFALPWFCRQNSLECNDYFRIPSAQPEHNASKQGGEKRTPGFNSCGKSERFLKEKQGFKLNYEAALWIFSLFFHVCSEF